MAHIFERTDNDGYALKAWETADDNGSPFVRFSAQRVDDGDYMAVDLDRDGVRELRDALTEWLESGLVINR